MILIWVLWEIIIINNKSNYYYNRNNNDDKINGNVLATYFSELRSAIACLTSVPSTTFIIIICVWMKLIKF